MELIQIGGNECGLDLDVNGPCTMEAAGLVPDFSRCDVPQFKWVFLSVAADRIRFYSATYPKGMSLKDWADHVMALR